MNYAVFTNDIKPSYKTIILTNRLNLNGISKEYIEPFGANKDEFLMVEALADSKTGKSKASDRKDFIQNKLIPEIDNLKVEILLVSNGDYFKTLTGERRADSNLGLICTMKDRPDVKVLYIPNYSATFYDPDKVRPKIALAMRVYQRISLGILDQIGSDIIKDAEYPNSDLEIQNSLYKLLQRKTELTVDIETFGLKHVDAGLGSISFSWNQHSGTAFVIDFTEEENDSGAIESVRRENHHIRKLLKQFFIAAKNKDVKFIYHNATFDITVLIYQLFMDGVGDYKGLLEGLEVMTHNIECTKIISYLAHNSASGNELSLKDQAVEFAGVWAVAGEAIKNILILTKHDLLVYNLTDTLSTYYVYNKNLPIMIRDQQQDIYENIFKPALIDVIHMQLTGMPVCMEEVLDSTRRIEEILKLCDEKIHSNKYVMRLASEQGSPFNPNSDQQKATLLYDLINLPVIELTKSGNPSSAGSVLESLINHTADNSIRELIRALIDHATANKVYTSFIPPLQNAVPDKNGHHWLFGFFNLGGTVSGRLSSNSPNLQNLPSGGNTSEIGRLMSMLIKKCFVAPKGKLLVGIDFDSLEDRISALTTRDPNKLKVYMGHIIYEAVIDGKITLIRDDSLLNGKLVTEILPYDEGANYPYLPAYDDLLPVDIESNNILSLRPVGNSKSYDGHSLRAYTYYDFGHKGYINTVNSINSLKKFEGESRDGGKGPTFAITYGGTIHVLMKKFGFTPEMAQKIFSDYHSIYSKSGEWVLEMLKEGAEKGYVTCAFGLRIRTPLLYGKKFETMDDLQFMEAAEARTAGNGLGQSWCLLNPRAMSEAMNHVKNDPKLRYRVMPTATIHDENIYLIDDDLDLLVEFNNIVVKATSWQDHPLIYHPKVKLSGTLGIFYPNWSKEIPVPNGSTKEDVINSIRNPS